MKSSLTFLILLIHSIISFCQDSPTIEKIKRIIYNSVKYMDENVSLNGGYVWNYKLDFSRRWGELEAYPSMIWVQGGTVDMGNLLLDLYEVIGEEYYYDLARKAARALIKGQLKCGGWNYFIDFAGEKSTKKWYSTIGKNAWRMEEFHQYAENATFDDNVTTGAAKFLLRFYLIKKDKEIKKSLDRAIDFIIKSQYSNGAWPQRFPLLKNRKDYTQYYTFNDFVIWNNLKFLIICYAIFKEKKFVEPIRKEMDFYILSQYKSPQAGWSLQYNFKLEPAQGRSYEPAALDPLYTAKHIEMLIKFYELTGDKKYLIPIPASLQWLKTVVLNYVDSLVIVPKFVELNTNKPIFIHRKGTNINFGSYYYDSHDNNIVIHYPCKKIINLKNIERQYELALNKQVSKNNDQYLHYPISDDLIKQFHLIENFLQLQSDLIFNMGSSKITVEKVQEIILKLDEKFRWLTSDVFISNPYLDETITGDADSDLFSVSYVGNKFDTSTYPNNTCEKFISVSEFIKNIKTLLNYIKDYNSKF